jgi:hypothetical protein
MPNDIRKLLEQAGLPSTYDLTRFARLLPDPAEWTLPSILPVNEIQSVRWRTSQFARTISAAKFRAYDAVTPLGRRVASRVETEGMLPPLGQKTRIGEFETILLQMQRGADAEELVSAIYDEGQSNAMSIRARWELARGDLLTDFRFTLNENGLVGLEADFGAPTGHTPTTATLWTVATSTPIDDELAWIALFRTDSGGITPEVRITSQAVANTLATNNQYRQAAYPGQALANVPTRLTPGQVNAVREQWDLPPLTIYDVTIDVDGVSTRPIPANRFILTTRQSGGLGETLVGITAEGVALAGSGNPRLTSRETPGIVVTRSVEDDPPGVWVRANAAGMPVLGYPSRLITAQVLA